MSAVVTAPDQIYQALDRRTLDLLERRRAVGMLRRGSVMRRALMTADLVGLCVAFFVAELLYDAHAHGGGALSEPAEAITFVVSLPLWIVAATLYGLYERDEERADHSTADDFNRLFHLITVCTFLLSALSVPLSWFSPQPSKLLVFWLLGIVGTTLLRAVARTACRKHISYLQNTIIVGAGDVGQLVARKLLKHPEYGLNLVGFVDDDPREQRDDLGFLAVLGGRSRLSELVELLDVERVIFAFSRIPDEEQVRLVRALRASSVQIDVVPRLFDVVGSRGRVHDVEGLPLISLRTARRSAAARAIKRSIDVVGASIALLLGAPLIGFICWRVRRESEGPIFFRQLRLGEGGKTFTCIKFRTMRADADQQEHADYIAKSARSGVAPQSGGLFKLDRSNVITPFGGWLRRTSLDELPQLLNVVRGDMSLVGPRPCIPYETAHFQPHHFERFDVPAGITGLWQVTARAYSTFGEALDLDVAYVRAWSLGLDLRLLARTPVQLLRQRGTR